MEYKEIRQDLKDIKTFMVVQSQTLKQILVELQRRNNGIN